MINIFSLKKHELNFNISIKAYDNAINKDTGISNLTRGILLHGDAKENIGCIKNVYSAVTKLSGSCKKMQKDFGFETTTNNCILCHRMALGIYKLNKKSIKC